MLSKKLKVIILILAIVIISLIIRNYIIDKYKKDNLEKFDLRSKIDLQIEYQKQSTYKSCYAYATLDCLETNLLLNQNKQYDFSELHVEYMTSKEFGGNRKLSSGGTFEDVISYILRGKGPVLEKTIPDKIYLKNEYKKIKNTKKEITIEKIKTRAFDKTDANFKNDIKKHIINNGAIYAGIYFDIKNNEIYNQKTNGYFNLYFPEVNHTIAIIGWDDNYSKYNFPKQNRPKENGAYIVISYWKYVGENGVIYISYEDKLINDYMRGIEQVILKKE